MGNAEKRVESLLKSEKMKCGVVSRLGEGAFGEVYSVGNPPEYVVKLFKKEGMARSEILALQEMTKKNFAVRVPKVLGYARDERGDAVFMSFLEGVPMNRIRLNGEKRRRAAKEIAGALKSFISDGGKSDADGMFFGELLGTKYPEWEDFYRVKAEKLLTKAKKLYAAENLSVKTLRIMESAFERFDEIFAGKKIRRAFVHGDLNPENIMLRSDGALSGFYDPIGSLYGDSEYELFQLETNGGKRFPVMRYYRDSVSLSETYPLKRDFYRLFAEVGYYYDANLKETLLIRRWAASLRKNLKRYVSFEKNLKHYIP